MTESCSVIPEAYHLINVRENYNIETAIGAAICCPPQKPSDHAERAMLCTADHNVTITNTDAGKQLRNEGVGFPRRRIETVTFHLHG